MGYRKVVKKAVTRLPVAGPYVKRKEELEKAVGGGTLDIGELRRTIKQLETRNDEWAAEVRALRRDDQPMSIIWPVAKEDIVAAKYQLNKKPKQKLKIKPPFTINWVVPPMGPVSGGHADIFRTIAYLESKGHTCRIYFYDPQTQHTLESIKSNLKNYTVIRAELFYNQKQMANCDAIFATNWHTAYPVANFSGAKKKFYYVQDFEPYFDPVGAYSTFAENTYRFGLHGVALGQWLPKKLTAEYNMTCDYFDLGVDKQEYQFHNHKRRKKILFYARPVTPRRGFELGVLALELFHKKHPEYEINFIGWDMSRYEIPFPYINKGILTPAQLSELYNECVAGLVLSFTNMSLLPLELLASGCIPVLNIAEHTKMVDYKNLMEYADPTPRALADALNSVVTNSKQQERAKQAAKSTDKYQWSGSNQKIENILLRELSA